MPAKFGTSGLRGLVDELRGDVAKRYVYAFATHLFSHDMVEKGHEVFVGWDLRQSSPGIAADVASALVASGLVPRMLGEIPTPVLAFHAMTKGRPSIMVTGSHIPADRNGIKFYLPTGEITKRDELAISESATSNEFDHVGTVQFGVESEYQRQALDAFCERCAIILPTGSLEGRIIGVYEHSSVGREMLHRVLREAGADTVALGYVKEFLALDTEDVSSAVKDQLKTWSSSQRLDAIVSADGDADRPLMTDESGELVRGDIIGILTARFLRSQTIATPVTSSSAIELALQANVLRTRVGSPHVIAAMLGAENQGATRIAGFEANGGFLVYSSHTIADRTLAPLPTRDAFLPILAVLSLAAQEDQQLSALAASLALPASLATRLENFATERSLALLQTLQTDNAARKRFIETLGEMETADAIDGYRMRFSNNSIVHLRPSGNAPELRIYVEAQTRSAAQKLLDATRVAILKH
jgi:phosphomannomutase